MSKSTYIKAVLVVFFLLILSRISPMIDGTITPEIIVSTVVEFIFLVWGILVLGFKRKESTDDKGV
ncbi:hypothetical protein [Clostridium grantii]|uniref:Uncharacterized protein n=1 Tax=Clostridium grantii DSM 8605 TaxID=1121316 RepID=A0A1M5XVP5_9CLOT|nr:hypothetical protein [Clostridium grantii]SHI03598.1 hypothetical protein SAMN02745207_03952 [Clostridium grantii DSM 8605]